jgi:hypothetical protein
MLVLAACAVAKMGNSAGKIKPETFNAVGFFS